MNKSSSGILLLLCAVCVRAEPLDDLHSALDRFSQPVSGRYQVSAKVVEANGKGDDKITREGYAEVEAVDTGASLSIAYSRSLLAQIDSEEQARLENSDAPTPAIEGVHELSALPVRAAVRAADQIRRVMGEGEYLGAEADELDGREVMRLDFSLPESRLSKRQRKYVKSYEGIYSVWIRADGVPLASSSRVDASGRAFIFISFHVETESQRRYGVVNDTLVALTDRYYHLSYGAGERFEREIQRTVTAVD
ncbi:hypothetical protein [Gilvimarinus sp. DA14]|uniref:hypothetical protein n=1 Tax=Gilvimarinus sp. DA14 TaxID=2956798 RepID=UPI0020B6D14B|nr:hypothetical protein [Gilvimarinus sp. DA14]UTF58853.1 hypothetical protein NHM04_10205 [Gilvimarinus sp. DA14]